MNALVLGFGPFLDIEDNPASRLALAVDGALDGRVVGRTMPVSYVRSLAFTREAVAEHEPTLLLGIGVARSRSVAMLERVARARCNTTPDVDGVCGVLSGQDREATLPDVFVGALGLPVSEDAGAYVCNAWLYGALEHTCHVGFLHIPPAGWSSERLVTALESVLRP